MFSTEALDLVKRLNPATILDIGAGTCEHARWMLDNTPAHVTAMDMVSPPKFVSSRFVYKKGMFDYYFPTEKEYDCVWMSHVLEHQHDVGIFLKQSLNCLKEGGWAVITVPPMKQQIVGGHVSVWNAGLLIYRLILAGLDCSQVKVKHYGYNVTVAVKKRTVKLPQLKYDNGDIETLSEFFPYPLNHQGFNGNIYELNWEK